VCRRARCGAMCSVAVVHGAAQVPCACWGPPPPPHRAELCARARLVGGQGELVSLSDGVMGDAAKDEGEEAAEEDGEEEEKGADGEDEPVRGIVCAARGLWPWVPACLSFVAPVSPPLAYVL
jgi:hypothetical protein